MEPFNLILRQYGPFYRDDTCLKQFVYSGTLFTAQSGINTQRANLIKRTVLKYSILARPARASSAYWEYRIRRAAQDRLAQLIRSARVLGRIQAGTRW
jgi:hypothetical protein